MHGQAFKIKLNIIIHPENNEKRDDLMLVWVGGVSSFLYLPETK